MVHLIFHQYRALKQNYSIISLERAIESRFNFEGIVTLYTCSLHTLQAIMGLVFGRGCPLLGYVTPFERKVGDSGSWRNLAEWQPKIGN
jgi:hypothetical protein